MSKVKEVYEDQLAEREYYNDIYSGESLLSLKSNALDKATKYDRRDKKPRVELIPVSAQIKEAEVLSHGAEKYGDDNWRKGMEWRRLLGAALRHIYAWSGGEDLDQESRLSHLAHARCCLGMLIEYQNKNLGKDDRQ